MATETVTITKEEYKRLLDRDLWLYCLEETNLPDEVIIKAIAIRDADD